MLPIRLTPRPAKWVLSAETLGGTCQAPGWVLTTQVERTSQEPFATPSVTRQNSHRKMEFNLRSRSFTIR
jgi:hypothetical protein